MGKQGEVCGREHVSSPCQAHLLLWIWELNGSPPAQTRTPLKILCIHSGTGFLEPADKEKEEEIKF